MQNPDISNSLKKTTSLFKKTHYIIFAIVLIMILVLTCLSVLSTFNMPTDTVYEQQLLSKKTVDNFDQNTTIPRVNKLEFSDQTSDITIPANQRINPFAE
ncbi:MAG: hypothetical protein Q7T74_07270 [Candidatus Saccharibacteria bacterium]|nr:hypothetical protein [Candidatus Saccharibacteria bacterium]